VTTQEQFQSLVARNQPHPVLNRNFMRYYPDNYADAFLPEAHLIKGKGCRVYDGAEIFSHAALQDADPYRFTASGRAISIVAYTYPKGVEAEEKKDRVMVSESELLIFMELLMDGSIEVHFRFGRDFTGYLSALGRSAMDMQDTVYRTDERTLRRFFSNDEQA
jgi:hypothetical protein